MENIKSRNADQVEHAGAPFSLKLLSILTNLLLRSYIIHNGKLALMNILFGGLRVLPRSKTNN